MVFFPEDFLQVVKKAERLLAKASKRLPMYPRWEPLSPCTFMLCTTEKVKQTKIYSGDKKKVKINQEETAKYLLTRLHLVDLSAPAFSLPSLRAPLCLSLPQKSLP